MSILDRIFGAAKAVIELRSDVDRSTAQIEHNTDQLFDHEKRLIRIETMIEMSADRPASSTKRLPRA